MKTRVLVIAALCGVALFGFSLPASSQVFLEEGKVELDVLPGENIAGKLTLHNPSGTAVTMRVYWEDFEYQPPFDGTKEFFPKGTSQFSLRDWANVATNTLTIDPFTQKAVSYTINVPEDFQGGHYGVLFFEKEEGAPDTEKGLKVVTRVGCLFFVEPQDKGKLAEVENFRISATGLMTELTNKGDVILIPEGSYYVIDAEGNVFDRGQMQKVYLPPGQTADYPLPFHEDLPPGAYTLVMNIELGDNDILVREIDFQKSYPSSYQIDAIRE